MGYRPIAIPVFKLDNIDKTNIRSYVCTLNRFRMRDFSDQVVRRCAALGKRVRNNRLLLLQSVI